MRRVTLAFAGLAAMLGLAAGVDAQVVFEQAGPVCGTERVMARMPAKQRGDLVASSVASRAAELMIYLHFDGGPVFGGFENAGSFRSSMITFTRNAPPAPLTEAQRAEVARLVADDYSPFNIRVTTDIAEFQAYPSGQREMVIVTTNPGVMGFSNSTGGVSPWVGPGFRLPNSISFVFASLYGGDLEGVASTASHESGHQLGLDHQHRFSSTCGFVAEYNSGFGSGPLAFSPLMGSGLAGGIGNWFAQMCRGPYDYSRAQDDYAMISDQVEVRADDYPDAPSNGGPTRGPVAGVLERGGDVDYIKINFQNPGPVTVASTNIDLKVSLLSPNGRLIETYNDPAGTGVTLPEAVGVKYLRIEGESNANMSSQFMTGTYIVTY